MSLLFETIRLQDGVFGNLKYHNFRLNESRKALFNSSGSIQLENILSIPANYNGGIYKCRIIYRLNIEEITFEPYIPRLIKSLKLVEDGKITYNHKFLDRKYFTELLANRGDFDEILIVQNGYITDTSFSNIIFFNGSDWITPATPLLPGTMRKYLLENKSILEERIRVTDLQHFQKARLINAMLPFGSGNDISVENIRF
jgi:4-amino-4-deoxychorismate lyase